MHIYIYIYIYISFQAITLAISMCCGVAVFVLIENGAPSYNNAAVGNSDPYFSLHVLLAGLTIRKSEN
jgi:hypothetical protein